MSPWGLELAGWWPTWVAAAGLLLVAVAICAACARRRARGGVRPDHPGRLRQEQAWRRGRAR